MERIIKENICREDMFNSLFWHCKHKLLNKPEWNNASIMTFYLTRYEDLIIDEYYCEIESKYIKIAFVDQDDLKIRKLEQWRRKWKSQEDPSYDEEADEDHTRDPVITYIVKYDRELEEFTEFIEREREY